MQHYHDIVILQRVLREKLRVQGIRQADYPGCPQGDAGIIVVEQWSEASRSTALRKQGSHGHLVGCLVYVADRHVEPRFQRICTELRLTLSGTHKRILSRR